MRCLECICEGQWLTGDQFGNFGVSGDNLGVVACYGDMWHWVAIVWDNYFITCFKCIYDSEWSIWLFWGGWNQFRGSDVIRGYVILCGYSFIGFLCALSLLHLWRWVTDRWSIWPILGWLGSIYGVWRNFGIVDIGCYSLGGFLYNMCRVHWCRWVTDWWWIWGFWVGRWQFMGLHNMC